MTTIYCIIPAAGMGSRMQADRPKQYLLVDQKPVLAHTVDLFTAMPIIKKVIVALSPDDKWWKTITLLHPEKIEIITGGQERMHSVMAGLTHLTPQAHEDDWVLVHDAARPYLKKETVLRMIAELGNHPVGGLLGMPVVDTLKYANKNDEVEKTISREHVWQAQTPQCFRYGILKKAITQALAQKALVTDESSAIELLGLQPIMIRGDSRNRKITFPEDFSDG